MTEFVEKVQIVGADGTPLTVNADGSIDISGGGGGGAPTDATYITQTPSAGLSAEQAMSALATGIVKNTTGTGVQSIAAAGTDYIAPSGFPVASPNVPGLGFENFPRQNAFNNATVLVSQRLSLFPMWLPAGLTITGITFYSASTGMTGGNHQIFGIFDNDAGSMAGGAARALLRGSNDDTSTAWNSNSAKTLNLTSTYVTPAAGRYYIGILVDASAVPTHSCSSGLNTAPLAASPTLGGPSNTGITALPNPASAITANTSNQPYITLT